MTRPPAIVADSSRPALVAQLDEVWSALAELGDRLSDAEWGMPTPCPGWDVAAQYAHIIGTEASLLGRPAPEVEAATPAPEHVKNQIGGFNEVWVSDLARLARADVLARLAETTAARREALAGMTDEDFDAPSWTPVGQADYRRFMQIRVFDCWVHEQDIRDAVGRAGHESGPVAEQGLDELVRAAGFVIGKKAGVSTGAGVRVELTGPVARRVDVEVTDRARVVAALRDDPTTTLELTSSAFSRLSCGRIGAAEVDKGAFGGVRITGDEAVGRRVLENLAFTI